VRALENKRHGVRFHSSSVKKENPLEGVVINMCNLRAIRLGS